MSTLTRRNFLATSLASATLLSASAEPIAKPNIVLIMADDQGYGDLRCYGNKTIKTPNIDGLANVGMRFTDFHSNCPVCSPTRAALLTGQYQQRSGIEGVVYAKHMRDRGLPLASTTLAEVLKDNGYATGLFGKWHLGYQPEFGPVKQGFDTFNGFVSGNVDYVSHIDGEGYADWWQQDALHPEKGYLTDLITNHAEKFIDTHKEEPFFLYMPHGAPHSPYQGRDSDALRTEGMRKPGLVGDTDTYAEMIEVMDESVGRIVSRLEKHKLTDNTIIIFCSDNGANNVGSNAQLRGHKGQVWEGGHRVPAIAAWPGHISKNTTTDATCISMDFFPTITTLTNSALPKGYTPDGVDLSPLLLRQSSIADRPLFWHYEGKAAMREGPWKLTLEKDAQGLYNLTNDPAENNDLSEEEPERFARMKKQTRNHYTQITNGVTKVS